MPTRESRIQTESSSSHWTVPTPVVIPIPSGRNTRRHNNVLRMALIPAKNMPNEAVLFRQIPSSVSIAKNAGCRRQKVNV